MQVISLFFIYLITAMFTMELAITILGLFNHNGKGIILGLISGFSDYAVSHYVVPYFHLFDGFHMLVGIVLVTLFSIYYLKISIGKSISICLLSYLVQAITEILMVLAFILIFGKESLETHKTVLIYFAALGQIAIVLIPTLYLKAKKLTLIGSFSK